MEAAVQACDAEVAKHGQAYYAVIAANAPSSVKAPPAKAAPARPNSAKPNALAASQLAAQVGDGLVFCEYLLAVRANYHSLFSLIKYYGSLFLPKQWLLHLLSDAQFAWEHFCVCPT